ncbi:DUF1350 family protein [Synechococcus elongatus IITB4]|uniref:DUF1350 family protein n=1 Tax=Synechococcus elongatus TaxID=32046 RepID=UPI0030CB5681
MATPLWQTIYDNAVLLPESPKAIVHFLGGAFIAAAPQVTYRRLLEGLGDCGFAVIATPFINTFDHTTLADEVDRSYRLAYQRLLALNLLSSDLPVFGVGHSMGSKLHLLMGCAQTSDRRGNILLAFNNYSARRSIPLLGQLAPALDVTVEFSPSPARTLRLIRDRYSVAHNLLVKFRNDEIDQTRDLIGALRDRFPETSEWLRLSGNHLTPVGQTLPQQTGLTWLDNVSQFASRELGRDLEVVTTAIADWCDRRLTQAATLA